MGLVRFLTVFDDEEERFMSDMRRWQLDISTPPTFFRAEDLSYLENFNVNSRDFTRIRNSGVEYTVPRIPSSIFHYGFEKIRDKGYLAAFLVCPHSKWTPYYKEAVHAAKKINRTAKRKNEKFFNTHVIDSKAFGFGAALFANELAIDFYHNRNNTVVIDECSRRYAESSATYILTKDNTIFGTANDYKAYRVKDTRVFELDIGSSVEEVKFDRFAQLVGQAVTRNSGKYAVSFGYDCDFIGNVLGRVERDYGHIPVIHTQYGIASAQLFGTQTICFHLGEYI